MTDTKDLLAQASAALDAERAANAQMLLNINSHVDALSAANIALQAQLDTANATIASLDPWASVDKGASLDVTAQFQALIDKGLAVPAGRYLIDAVRGLVATRNVTLDPNAVLVVKPNSAPKYRLLTLADGVTLTGGQILGDRLAHTYTAGSTHEWGCGLVIKGANCIVDGLKVSQCTGDGIEVIGDNAAIRNVKSTQNRRQGMSIFGVQVCKVEDSEFSYTGAMGTNLGAPMGPCAGVDIEPDAGSATGITFARCTFADNQTAGLLLWTRSGTGSAISAIANNCTFARNANGINAKSLSGQPVTLAVNGGTFESNRSSAARIDSGATLTIANAKVTGTLQRYALQGTSTIKASGMVYG